MRYFVTGEQHRKSLLNALVLMFLVYIALLWVSNGMMYFHHMDLTPDSVIAYYLGSEEQFTQPRSYQGMLEVSHFHLFSMGMLVLTLTHLMLMTEFSVRLKIWLSSSTYAAALADEAGGWLVRFVDPLFAYFKIAAFVVLELSLAALLIVVITTLVRARIQMSKARSE
ncbi:hypothetical protein [Methylobacter tundripaludum]|jgi:hypothetical protein|uniref:Uncharacterized protein n=1 Tax=Methylobacter tundripaludum (strain ATCC BAA-1195 / DSM 17260 / SV96) TaxID=697282 RepID=G3IXD4_METTV|nr:hypothetical protein [Methylobacter tundripaludum]EGW23191.1 hypothetical protein Mettu_2034 [Methylobacter tundripaludum SV96]